MSERTFRTVEAALGIIVLLILVAGAIWGDLLSPR
jgi:hypothetical protein